MKTTISDPRGRAQGRGGSAPGFARWTAGLALALGLTTAGAQVVDTIAGAYAGFVDGNNIQDSQFNDPRSLAMDADGSLAVADRLNNAVRKISFGTSKTSTLLTNLWQPVEVAYDNARQLYVLTEGDGMIRRYDTNRIPNCVGTNAAGLVLPTAFTRDGAGFFYVTEAGGSVWRINPTNAAATLQLAAGLSSPQGIAVLRNGYLAVSEATAHRIRVLNPTNPAANVAVSNLCGGLGAGFRDGAPELAMINSPHKLVRAPNGMLVLADRGNHRVRLVATNGHVSTVYGIDPSKWETCLECNPQVLQGWADGTVTGDPYLDPAAREPLALYLNAAGNALYVTENYYHIIRQVTGIDFSYSGSGGGTNGTILVPPVLTPNSGYYPNGIAVVVESPYALVYYTTDGTEPTTNSASLPIVNNQGIIWWSDPLHDVSALRVRAFNNGLLSEVVGGARPAVSQVGFTRDLVAGVGSKLIVPLVTTLQSNMTVGSLLFSVELTTTNGAGIPRSLGLVSSQSNDFIKVKGPAVGGLPVSWQTFNYDINTSSNHGWGMIFFSGGQSLQVGDFATLALLSIVMPTTNTLAHTYQLNVVNLSGTSAGGQPVTFQTLPARTVTMNTNKYLVGDSSPAQWYNAGDFGETTVKRLTVEDVNNAFYAAVGAVVPVAGTDLYDAMDVYPEDRVGQVGGDGKIEPRDWEIILRRAQRDPGIPGNTAFPNQITNNWMRFWSTGSNRRQTEAVGELTQAPPPPPLDGSEIVNGLWQRDAILGATSIGGAAPGTSVMVPVFLRAAFGVDVSTLQFRAIVTPLNGAPAVTGQVNFQGLPANFTTPPGMLPPPQTARGWYGLSLRGSNSLGVIIVPIPAGARAGDVYEVSFENAALQSYDQVETLPGRIYVGQAVPPIEAGPALSYEWCTNYFGRYTNHANLVWQDDDGDGAPNWQEYLAGTDPTNHISRLEFEVGQTNGRPLLRWPSALGKAYVIECKTNLIGGTWTAISTNLGAGRMTELPQAETGGQPLFYRLRLLTQ